VVSICNNDDDSGRYDHPVFDVEVSCESLAKHHPRHILALHPVSCPEDWACRFELTSAHFSMPWSEN